ncbi:MAG TPA: hypothetical protein VF718_01440 [Allosphingosinicella sp.]|jgi:hypothetical protein
MAHRKKVAGLWRKRFLRALARTANAKLSAEMAGVDHSTAFQLRKRDPGFAAAWPRARAWGRERVKAEGRPAYPGGRPRPAGSRGTLDPRELKARRSGDGGMEIVRCGEGRMSPASDAIFFAHLAAGHGVRRSAAVAGFSTTAVYNRRMTDPGFAAQWEAAKDQCLARNDMLLIESVPRTLDPEISEAAEALPRPTIAEAIQIQRLYRAREPGARRPGRGLPERNSQDAMKSILTKIEAIERHEEPKKLAEGWVQDEAGNWIPPGWARIAS